MSFGFGVGDFIAVINEVSKLRKAVVGAPPQFKELSDEYVLLIRCIMTELFANMCLSRLRALQAVVHDVDASLSDVELDGNQKNDLTAIAKSCRNTLDDIEKVVNQYSAKESNRIGRIWRRVTWDSDELGRLRDRVCVNIGNLNAFNGRLARIQISDVLMNMSDEHDQLCLDWLSSTSHAIQQEKYGDLRQPGSGKWLLDSQMFMEWIRVQQQTLFCPGIPGAGKTIIVSAVIDEVNNIHKDNPEVGIAYIYSNFQYLHDDRQKINSLMASIARQLLQSMQKMPPSILKMFNTHRSKGTRPSTSELFEVFLSIIDKLQRVFLIVDALDELDDPNKFLDQIFGLQRTEKVSFLATSRFMPEIVTRFEGMPLLEIQASREDVTNYLSTSLKDMPYLSKQPRLHPEIIKEICDAVDGM
jgi:Cdc6-like AAA superfamily ATPase